MSRGRSAAQFVVRCGILTPYWGLSASKIDPTGFLTLNTPVVWTDEVEEMLVVETIARIRRDHLVRGVPIKKIARDLRVSKNTVRRVVRGDETSFS